LVDTISPALLWVTQDIQTKRKTMREEDEKYKKNEKKRKEEREKFKEANDGWDPVTSDWEEEEKEEDDDEEEEEEGEEEKKKKKEEKKKIRALGHDCTHHMYDGAMQKTSVCTHYLCEAERRKSKAKEAKEKEEEAAKNELRASKFKGIRRKLYGDLPKTGADSGEECSPLRSTASSEKGADSVFDDGEDEVFLMAAGSPTSKVLPQEG
jgi:hypothetical protein